MKLEKNVEKTKEKRKTYDYFIKSRLKTMKRYEITFNKNRDTDIISYIDNNGGATYIKNLIINDVRKGGN